MNISKYLYNLRLILQTASHKIYGISVTVSTEETMDGRFKARISGPDFKNSYKSMKTATPYEA